MKKRMKRAAIAINSVAVFLMTFLAVGNSILPSDIRVTEDIPVLARVYMPQKEHTSVAVMATGIENVTFDETYALFGTLPVKTVSVTHAPRQTVCVGGDVIGLELLTDGVVVTDMQSFETEDGEVAPAKDAGLEKGDLITHVDGIEIADNESFSAAIEKSGGKNVELTVLRENKELKISVLPRKCKQNEKFRCGAWVRDSTVGIGTMTCYDPVTGIYAALGHCVSDCVTGEELPIAGGRIVGANVWNIKKGERGTAGELGGTLEEDVIGSIEKNTQTGVYGILYEEPLNAGEYPVAWATEVKTGPAQILLSLDGEKIESYEAQISRINIDYNAEIKNMVVEITDEELLEKTGGIVQGMSGSPIIQDGMLVGAVTHVLVNDPTKGYGIFIENVLNAAGTLAVE